MKKPESQWRARRRARLVDLLAEFGGAAQVARESGTPKSHFSAMVAGKRGLGDVLAAKLEGIYNKPAGWFDEPDKVDSPKPDLVQAAPHPERRSSLSNFAQLLGRTLDQIKDPKRKLVAFQAANQAVLAHWLPSDEFGDDPDPVADQQHVLPIGTLDEHDPSGKPLE